MPTTLSADEPGVVWRQAKTGIEQDAARTHLEEASPQRRLMTPEEVAYLAVSLCDPLAAGVNGQSIVLDGGAVQT